MNLQVRIRKRNFLNFYHILKFIIISIFFNTSIFSQGTNEKDQGNLESNKPPSAAVEEKPIIVVTGSRREQRLKDSTSMTEVISKKRIEQTGARNLGEVLQGQLGVDVVPFFGGSRVRMLGMDSQYVLFLVDSERIAGRLDNAVDLTRFKTQNIERIEIVKGSSSALYGADAMGGVINMITRETEKDQEYNLRTTYGNGRKNQLGTQGDLHSTANVGFKKEFVSANFTSGFNSSPGYKLDPSTEATTGNKFKDVNVGSNFTFNPNGKFQAKGRIIYNNRDQSGIDVTQTKAIFDRDNKTNDLLSVGILQYDFGNKNRISFRGNLSRWDNKFENQQRLSTTAPTKELTSNLSSQGTVQLDYEVNKDHFVSVGVESFADELESDRVNGRFKYRTRKSMFLQDEWTFFGNKSLRFIPGVRYDDDSIFGNKTTPKFAMRYDINRDLIFRASYGRGFRPPSFQDLFLRFENPGVGYVVEGNNNLRPEKSITVNSDLEYTPVKWITLSLSLFKNDLYDLLQYKLLNSNRGELTRFQLINISRAYTRGGEAAIAFRFQRKYQLELGYNQTDTRDLTNDRPLDGRPLHTGILNFTYSSPWGLELFIRGKRVDKRPYYRDTNQFTNTGILNSDNPERQIGLDYAKPYTLLNVRLEQTMNENYSIFAGVENLLDAYEERYNPTRPKFYYMGFNAKF